MSDDDDAVPIQEVRQAVHRAATSVIEQSVTSAAPRPSMPDPYQREASALLAPGMHYDEVVRRVTTRMGLAAEAPDGSTQIWYIKQSAKWIALEVEFENQKLLSWSLLRINGTD